MRIISQIPNKVKIAAIIAIFTQCKYFNKHAIKKEHQVPF